MISEANHPSRIAVVLLQLVPVQPAWTNEGKTLWSCHHIRYLHTLEFYSKTPRVKISYLFTSHDDIHHVCMQWDDRSLLLFSDPYKVLSCSTDKFQESDQPCYQPTASSNGSKIFFCFNAAWVSSRRFALQSANQRNHRNVHWAIEQVSET